VRFGTTEEVRTRILACSIREVLRLEGELIMAITDVSPIVANDSRKTRFGADGYVLIVGLVAVAALGIGRLLWEPSFAQKQQSMQTALTAEHMKACDQLGKSTGSNRDDCLKLLDTLYMTHQRAILADSSEI